MRLLDTTSLTSADIPITSPPSDAVVPVRVCRGVCGGVGTQYQGLQPWLGAKSSTLMADGALPTSIVCVCVCVGWLYDVIDVNELLCCHQN